MNAVLPTIYASYEDALSHCGAGYSDTVLNAVRFFKAANIIQQLLHGATGEGLLVPVSETTSMFQIMCSDRSHQYRVLDFGGGFALSYFLLSRRMGCAPRWAVVETSLTTALGKAFEAENLRFFDNIDAACDWLGDVDAVHTNAALQYQPCPETTLQSLASLGARHIALLRCALSADSRVIQVQQSPLSENYAGPLPAGVTDRPVWYPHTSICESDFTRILMDADYLPVRTAGRSINVNDRATTDVGALHNSHFLYRKD